MSGVALIGEAEWMAAIDAHVLREAAPAREEADAVRPEEADRGMAYELSARVRFQEAVTAMARVFGEPVPSRHGSDAMSEQAAGVPYFLAE